MNPAAHSVFTYLYRDASNYKAWNDLLLVGHLTEEETQSMRRKFEGSEFFIAEQLGIPTLYKALWESCQCEGPTARDHVWHEFHEIRAATPDDICTLDLWGDAKELAKRVADVASWNEKLSNNWPRP